MLSYFLSNSKEHLQNRPVSLMILNQLYTDQLKASPETEIKIAKRIDEIIYNGAPTRKERMFLFGRPLRTINL